jgi:hypothetical protein
MAYRTSIFTYLDILGFKELINTLKADEVADLLSQLRDHAEPDDRLANDLEIRFQTFSDCTVRSVPLDSKSNQKNPSGILFHELLNLVHAQYRLIVDGYFMRGGVTIGQISFDDQMVFGPAMVRAYTLEQDFAVYPRIVIDPYVFEVFESDPLMINDIHDVQAEKEYLRQLIRRDSDGIYFVDYLRGMMAEFDEPGMEFDFLRLHKDLIVKNASKDKTLDRVSAKYLWVATYHNDFIRAVGKEQLEKAGQDINDFIIKPANCPLVYELGEPAEEEEEYEV